MRKQVAILLAMVLVLCMIPGVSATEDTGAGILLDTVHSGTDVQVEVSVVGGEGVTNGRLTITYDPDAVVLQKVTAASGFGAVSVNTEEVGSISIAWVGSSMTSDKAPVAAAVFRPVTQQTLTFTAQCPEAYAGKEKVSVSDGSASFASNPFVDIEGHWAEEEILHAYHMGWVNGVTDRKFVPDGTLSRAMFITVLHRMAGSPATDFKADFNDLEDGRYYMEAVNWAAEAGIVEGVGEHLFLPHKTTQRQEMITMLYRYAQFKEMDVTTEGTLESFKDYGKISGWAEEAMTWAVEKQILNGFAGGYLLPRATSTRAQAVTILCRFLDKT